MLPESVDSMIKQEISCASGDGMLRLVRRKGDQGTGSSTVYAENQSRGGHQKYDLLTDESGKEELLNFWMEFHDYFPYRCFTTFYSKKNFCIFFSQADLNITQIDRENCFISLLADQQFLFLEDNEHGNNPEYPPMSEIVHNPGRYVTHGQASAEPCTGTTVNADLKL